MNLKKTTLMRDENELFIQIKIINLPLFNIRIYDRAFICHQVCVHHA